MKNAWRVAAAYVGGVIGAGFISGQESLRFFGRYGQDGCWGMFLVTFGFALVGALQMTAARVVSPRSYKEFLRSVCGPVLSSFIDKALGLFLFAGTAIMIAGGGAVVHQMFGYPAILGSVLMVITTALVVMIGTRAVLWFNSWLVSAIVLVLVILAFVSKPVQPLNLAGPSFEAFLLPSWWVAGSVYLSYNSLLAVGLFSNLGGESAVRSGQVAGAVIGGLLLGLLNMCVMRVLTAVTSGLWSEEIPMFLAAARYGALGEKTYGLVTWAAMATTAVVNTYALAYRLRSSGNQAIWKAVAVVLAVCLPVSRFGFSTMIETLYPIFGYVGMVYIAVLLRFVLHFGRARRK